MRLKIAGSPVRLWPSALIRDIHFMKACPICGREFDPGYSWQKYCSPDCRKQAQLKQQRDWHYAHQPNPLPPVAQCDNCGSLFKPNSSQHRYCVDCSEALQRQHKRQFSQRYRAEGREDRSSWAPQEISKEDRRERWQRYYQNHKAQILDRIRRRRYEQGQFPGDRSEYYWTNRNYLVYELEMPCTVCGTREDLHAHHIIPVEEGGTDDLDNLIILCEAHHIGSGTGIHSLGPAEFAVRYGIWLQSGDDSAIDT